ncbi:MAG TPA: BBP7 family outer membrane beta-barrel protein [Gemmatales bacterium]|nr:BBP7 family outer membrane beta-barrel protein [Gemmatales bacterium]
MKRKMIWSLSAMLAGTGFAAAQDVELASVKMASSNAARTGQIATGDCAGCSTGCSGSFLPDYKFYGSAEVLVWQLGSSFSSNSGDSLPTFRASMPYGFRTTAYNLTNPLVPVQLTNPDGSPLIKDISGIARLEPSIQSGSGLEGLDRTGGRLTIGMFLDSARDWSAELSYFQLETKGTQYTGIASAQNVQFQTGLQNVVIMTTPGSNGSAPIETIVQTPVNFSADFNARIEGASSSKFFGFEANVNNRYFTIGQTKVSGIYGLRYLDLTLDQTLFQSITVRDDIYIIDAFTNRPATNGSTTFLAGDYQAHNQFFGAQVGARFDSDYGRFFINGFGKFAFGGMRQELITNEAVFNTDIFIPEDVYPSQTILRENHTRLAFVLEGNLSAGFHLTENLSVFAGYNVMVMTRVAQFTPNDAPASGSGKITLGTAENPIPVTNIFTEGRYYAQGLNLGLEFRY